MEHAEDNDEQNGLGKQRRRGRNSNSSRGNSGSRRSSAANNATGGGVPQQQQQQQHAGEPHVASDGNGNSLAAPYPMRHHGRGPPSSSSSGRPLSSSPEYYGNSCSFERRNEERGIVVSGVSALGSSAGSSPVDPPDQLRGRYGVDRSDRMPAPPRLHSGGSAAPGSGGSSGSSGAARDSGGTARDNGGGGSPSPPRSRWDPRRLVQRQPQQQPQQQQQQQQQQAYSNDGNTITQSMQQRYNAQGHYPHGEQHEEGGHEGQFQSGNGRSPPPTQPQGPHPNVVAAAPVNARYHNNPAAHHPYGGERGGQGMNGGAAAAAIHHSHPHSHHSHGNGGSADANSAPGAANANNTNTSGGGGVAGGGTTAIDITKSPGLFTHAYRRHVRHLSGEGVGGGGGHSGGESDHGYSSGGGVSDHHHYYPEQHPQQQQHHHHQQQQLHQTSSHYSHQPQHHSSSSQYHNPHPSHPYHHPPSRSKRHLVLTKVFQCTVVIIVCLYVVIVRRGANLLEDSGGTRRDWFAPGGDGSGPPGNRADGGFGFGSGSGSGSKGNPAMGGSGGGGSKGGGRDGLFGPAGNGLPPDYYAGGSDTNGKDGISDPMSGGEGDIDAPVTSVSSERAIQWKTEELRRARNDLDGRSRSRKTRAVPRRWMREDGNIGDGGDGNDNDGRADEIEATLRTTSRHSFALLEEDRSGLPPPLPRPLQPAPEIPPVDLDETNADGTALTEEQIQEKEEERQKLIDAHADALDKLSPAALDDLCGYEARNASQVNPDSYLLRDSLNENSRVLITGILNPIGFHLALELQNRCGVRTIMGIDNMFPNSILHRLEMVRRMGILSKEIPGLSQPIMLPYVGLDPRLNPKKLEAGGGGPNSIDLMLPATGEINFLTFRPTHVVHLASAYPSSYRDDKGFREGKHNLEHVYVTENRTPPMYQMRMAGAGMEHILASIATAPDDTALNRNFRPHFVYTSSRRIGDADGKEKQEEPKREEAAGEDFHPTIKMVDEMLATSYSSLHGVYSVGLRLGDVYGPWGVDGLADYDLAEAAVSDWERHSRRLSDEEGEPVDKQGGILTLKSMAMQSSDVSAKRNLLFVDDAVDSIIAAMQYRKEDETATIFDLDSGYEEDDDEVTLESIATMIEGFMPGKKDEADGKALPSPRDQANDKMTPRAASAKQYLGWSPATAIRDGVAKLLAWHLDKRTPYGPAPDYSDEGTKDSNVASKGTGSSPTKKELDMGDDDEAAFALSVENDGPGKSMETGDEFLKRNGFSTCAPDDPQCHRGSHVLPCVSECVPSSSSKSGTCRASIYDGVVDLTKDVTAGCDIVLYTSSIGSEVEELQLKATFEEEEEEDLLSICNVAFVTSSSKLVDLAITNVPPNALEDIQSDEDKAAGKPVPKVSDLSTEEKLVSLNGRILHKGWILIWVPDMIDDIYADDIWVPKLTPGRLMNSDVNYAMFVDEFFAVTPNADDVRFLVSELHRPALKERPFHKFDENGKKLKFVLPAEPERRAAILMNTIKQKKSKEEDAGDAEKISVYDAAKFMVYENGGDPSVSDPRPLKRQREFYERVTSFVNRDDLRSIMEPVHKYEMKHWIRSRWVIHDLKVEEGRQIRCDWFREHAHWGNPLDQLSFAHIMAVRDVERKFIRNEPDDRMRAAMPQEPEEIAGIGDKTEWHPLIGPDEALDKKKRDLEADASAEGQEEDGDTSAIGTALEDRPNQYYARIMSDKIMLICRKIWTENEIRRKQRREKKREREEEGEAVNDPGGQER